MNKYRARRTWSEVNQRWFASKLEMRRADELALLQKAGYITDLEFQKKFVLSDTPRVTITIDFCYIEDGKVVYEDTKGVLTRDFRTKLAWLKQLYEIEVNLIDGHR